MNSTPRAEKRLVDVRAISHLLDVSPKTVRRMVDRGKIPGIARLGRLLRFDLTVIGQWVNQGCPALHRFNPNFKI